MSPQTRQLPHRRDDNVIKTGLFLSMTSDIVEPEDHDCGNDALNKRQCLVRLGRFSGRRLCAALLAYALPHGPWTPSRPLARTAFFRASMMLMTGALAAFFSSATSIWGAARISPSTMS
jgi:hypothetical protein